MRQISEGPFEGIAVLGSGKTFICLLCFMRARLRGRVTGADSNLYEHMRAHHGLNIGTVAGVYLATRKRFDELARAIQAADAGGAKRAWDALRAHNKLKEHIIPSVVVDQDAWLERARVRLLSIIPTEHREMPSVAARRDAAPPADRAPRPPHRDRPPVAPQRRRTSPPPRAPEVLDLCSDSDAEPARPKRERSASPVRRLPAPARPESPPTAGPSSAATSSPLIPAGHSAGELMPLDEFCTAYHVGKRVRDVLAGADYSHSHTLKYLTPEELIKLKLSGGELAQLRSALERWSVREDGGAHVQD